jgi:hypothetical protein
VTVFPFTTGEKAIEQLSREVAEIVERAFGGDGEFRRLNPVDPTWH